MHYQSHLQISVCCDNVEQLNSRSRVPSGVLLLLVHVFHSTVPFNFISRLEVFDYSTISSLLPWDTSSGKKKKICRNF